MPESAGYEAVLSSKAVASLTTLSRAQQKIVIGLLVRLAEHPGQPGDYTTRDGQGREIQHLRLANWRISFWPDHAGRELRVTDVSRL